MSFGDDLAAGLRAHVPTTVLENEHRDRMLRLLDAGPDAFSRDHFTPGHFTASAFVLSPDRSELLLIHHRKLGMWLQPGGHVETCDRDIIASARREVEEEVGLADLSLLHPGTFDLDVHNIPARKTEPAHEHFDVRMLFGTETRELGRCEEILDARWVPFGEVENLHSDESVMRAMRRLGGFEASAAG